MATQEEWAVPSSLARGHTAGCVALVGAAVLITGGANFATPTSKTKRLRLRKEARRSSKGTFVMEDTDDVSIRRAGSPAGGGITTTDTGGANFDAPAITNLRFRTGRSARRSARSTFGKSEVADKG